MKKIFIIAALALGSLNALAKSEELSCKNLDEIARCNLQSVGAAEGSRGGVPVAVEAVVCKKDLNSILFISQVGDSSVETAYAKQGPLFFHQDQEGRSQLTLNRETNSIEIHELSTLGYLSTAFTCIFW